MGVGLDCNNISFNPCSENPPCSGLCSAGSASRSFLRVASEIRRSAISPLGFILNENSCPLVAFNCCAVPFERLGDFRVGLSRVELEGHVRWCFISHAQAVDSLHDFSDAVVGDFLDVPTELKRLASRVLPLPDR